MRESRAPGQAPRDWNEAFAALPPETPATDALSGVFAQLPASARRRSLQLPLALAASLLALAVIIPTWMSRHARDGGRPVSLASSSQSTTAVPLQTPASVVVSSVPTEVAPDRKTLDARLRGHDEQKQSIAKADRPHRKPHRTRQPLPAIDPPDDAMEPLYAESARLEALLALASDDRVASATAVALGSDFESRIAGIDAALMQPSLTSQRRLDLWRERVSALRAYASFESTQRALAAGGERYDAMLVSID